MLRIRDIPRLYERTRRSDRKVRRTMRSGARGLQAIASSCAAGLAPLAGGVKIQKAKSKNMTLSARGRLPVKQCPLPIISSRRPIRKNEVSNDRELGEESC